MRAFIGVRLADGTALVYDRGPSSCIPMASWLWVRSHSPSGLEWGYCGSGPAQLALSILCEVLGDPEAAVQLYQRFKRQVVARLPRGGWLLTYDEVAAWVMAQLGGEPVSADDVIDLGAGGVS